MVDVGEKAETRRVASAAGRIVMAPETLTRIIDGAAAKGDVLAVARIAAIQAAKRTSDLIPLCHPLAITKVAVDFQVVQGIHAIECTARVETLGRTGVEMEALVAVTAGLLTIYDMCKSVDRAMRLESVELREKHGGKSGSWVR